MTPAEYARHRKCGLSVVQYALRAGRLTRSARKDRKGRWSIDAAAADAEWAQTTKADRVPLTGPTAPAGASVVAMDYAEARRRREAAEAEKAELELAEMKGEVVRVAEVRAKVEARYATVRTKVLAAPSRIRQRCPHLAPADIAFIEEELRDALADLGRSGARPDPAATEATA